LRFTRPARSLRGVATALSNVEDMKNKKEEKKKTTNKKRQKKKTKKKKQKKPKAAPSVPATREVIVGLFDSLDPDPDRGPRPFRGGCPPTKFGGSN